MQRQLTSPASKRGPGHSRVLSSVDFNQRFESLVVASSAPIVLSTAATFVRSAYLAEAPGGFSWGGWAVLLLLISALLPTTIAQAVCGVGSYSLPGSSSCAPCAAGTTYVPASTGGLPVCAPPSSYGPTSGLVFYYGGTQAEGLNALSVLNNSAAISYTADRFGNAGGALALDSGASIMSGGFYSTMLTGWPVDRNVSAIAAFYSCSSIAATASATVFELGGYGLTTATTKLSLVIAGTSVTSAVPGPYASATVCDGRWHHHAMLFDGTRFKRYFDGTLVAQSAVVAMAIPFAPTLLSPVGSQLRIGAALNAPAILLTYTAINSQTWVVPAGVTNVSILVVAGGGGGGGTSDRTAGGGGGGGFICNANFAVTPGQSLTITVGAGGGGGGSGSAGTSGGNSVFGTLTAIGGGGGGGASSSCTGASAKSGGSGGGRAHKCGTSGSGTTSQGYAGGASAYDSGSSTGVFTAAGGGGAGAIGGSGTSSTGGAGGIGAICTWYSSSTYFAGGGGGSSENAGEYL